MKSFFFRYISVTVYRIQRNCEQIMFSALKNPKENKEKEKEWNKILTICHKLKYAMFLAKESKIKVVKRSPYELSPEKSIFIV